ncbi:Serine/threonine-protein phosphatase [Entamoeba marina]
MTSQLFQSPKDLLLEDIKTVNGYDINKIMKHFKEEGRLHPAAITDILQSAIQFREPPGAGLFCDLLWADPVDESVFARLSETQQDEWHNITFTENKVRGCSYCYGFQGVDNFLAKNEITSIIRAHEVQKEGCNLHYFNRDDITHPLVMTLFTAPNYCDVYENDGAVLVLLDNELSFLSYNSVPHPFWLPKFQTGIQYSLPIFCDALSDIAKKFYALSLYHDFVDDEEDKPIKFALTDEVQETEDSPKKQPPSINEDFLVPLDINNTTVHSMINRRRSFVGGNVSSFKPKEAIEKRQRCCTFSMKGKFDSSTDRFSFTITASPRFDSAKSNDIENEKRPPLLEDLKKNFGIQDN